MVFPFFTNNDERNYTSKRTSSGRITLSWFFALLLLSSTAQAQKPQQSDTAWTYDAIIKVGLSQLALAKKMAKSAEDPVLIAPLDMLAATYETKGDYRNAITYYQKSIKIREALFAKNPAASNSGLIFAMTKLGIMLHNRGRTHEAEPYVKRALKLRTKAQGRQRVSLPDLLNNLAVIYQAQGRYTEAEPLLKRAMELRKKENVPLNIALAQNNLAELFVSLDRLSEAEKLHRNALEIRQREAPNSTVVALSLNNLASVYQFQRRYQEAETLYRKALSIWQNALGAAHPNVATAENNLAVLLVKLKRYEEAARLNEQVLKSRRALLGADHPLVAGTLSNIAKVHIAQGRFAQAIPFVRQTLEIDEKTQRPDHPFIRRDLQRLIELYGKLNKRNLAAPLKVRLDAMPPAGMKHLPLFYVTNRAVQQVAGAPAYGGKKASKLHFGRATVQIPKSEIKRQALRRAKASGLLDKATGKLTAAAQLKLLRIKQRQNFTTFSKEALEALRLTGLFKDQLLIFIHGYNVSFDEALLRAAQINFDLEFDGALMPFIWPSQGELSGYQIDEKNAAAAAEDLVKLLRQLGRHFPGKKVHFIAHSMGNRVLLRALKKLSHNAEDWQQLFQNIKLGEIIWAHPDVNRDEFSAVAKRLADLGASMTLYSTRDDWALWASKLFHGIGRAGSELITVPGVDTIDITGLKAVDRGWFEFDLNHNVFVRNPILFGDITRLLLTSQRPVHQRSPDFEKIRQGGKKYWRFKPIEIAKN